MKLKESNTIYEEIKQFYDINPEGIYPYQNLDNSGRQEYRHMCSSESSSIERWQKVNMSLKLSELIINICSKKSLRKDLERYLKENPIILYYDVYIDMFKECLNSMEKSESVAEFLKEIIKETNTSEVIKAAIISASLLNDEELCRICETFSCHNDYIFYYLIFLRNRNENEKIFNVCRNSCGYGRALSIMLLNVTSTKMRKWVIEEGLNNNAGTSEILKYTLLSYNFMKYINETKYDAEKFEKIAMYIGKYLFGEYEINEIDNGIDICSYIINTVSENFGGIYSLYCVTTIMNYFEDMLLYNFSGKSDYIDDENNIKYKEFLYRCRNICKDKRWHSVLYEELKDIDIDADIILSCAERIKYKIKKSEFKNLFVRNSKSPLLYNYAFSCENKVLQRFILTEGLNKLNIAYVLSGQDSLHIEQIKYNETEHVCYFIIINNIKFNGNEDIFKKINIEALNSPVIETRKCAIENLTLIKETLDDYDKDTIIEIKDREVSSLMREELDILIGRKNYKRKKYINVDRYTIIKPHVKDVQLAAMEVEGSNFIDMSEINNELFEKSIVYIVKRKDSSDICTVTTYNGYVIGYLSKESSEAVFNLVKSHKYVYGAVKSLNEDYSSIIIDVYLSYQDVIDEIESTLSLLSSYGKSDILQ